MKTTREETALKVIRRLENALIAQAAMTNRGGNSDFSPLSDDELADAEKMLLDNTGTSGKTALKASKDFRESIEKLPA